MHGMRTIEDKIVKNYKYLTPIAIAIVLALYVLSVNNHYKLFLEEINNMRNNAESRNREYQLVNAFNNKLFNHADLIGRSPLSLNIHEKGGSFKIAANFRTNSGVKANNNLKRVINSIKKGNSNIDVYSFRDGISGSDKFVAAGSEIALPIEQPGIYVLGEKNHILSIFVLDGNESLEELQLISKYILKIVNAK